MKPNLLTILLLTAGLTAAVSAHETKRRDEDTGREERSSRPGRSEERIDCSRSDPRRHRDAPRPRQSRRACDDPPVIIYPAPDYRWGYFPAFPPPWYYNGRFVPMPIPRRPVYLLPGMR